jgi:hypothetical protein
MRTGDCLDKYTINCTSAVMKRGRGEAEFPPKRQYVGCSEAEFSEPRASVQLLLQRYFKVSDSSMIQVKEASAFNFLLKSTPPPLIDLKGGLQLCWVILIIGRFPRGALIQGGVMFTMTPSKKTNKVMGGGGGALLQVC